MDGELYLRLRVERVVAAGAANHHTVTSGLKGLADAALALRAVGAITADTAAQVVAEAELALVVRGATWLDDLMADLPAPRRNDGTNERGRLVSAATAGDTLVEVWANAMVVRSAGGDSWATPGGVPEGHDRVEVRTSTGTASFDLTRGIAARAVVPRQRPIGPADTAIAWVSIAESWRFEDRVHVTANATARSDDDRAAFESIAITVAGGPTITALEGGSRIHLDTERLPAAAWIVTPATLHHVALPQLTITPPLPSPPQPATLVLVDRGRVAEVDLRP